MGRACGLPPVAIGDILRPIQQYCTENGLPPLTSIVVNKSDGLPGEGFLAENVPLAQIQTFERDWLESRSPTVEQLADAYTRAPDRKGG
jgi:putative restriction endonuclease